MDNGPFSGTILLTEGGELTIRFEEGEIEPHTDFHKTWNTIEGESEQGHDVVAEKASLTQHRNFSLTQITPKSVCISKDEDLAPAEDEKVVVDFDVLCFQPQIPPRNQLDSDTREGIESLSESTDQPTLDIPEEFELTYIETDDHSAYGVPLVDTTDRKDIIKNDGQKIRTAKIRIKQRIHGDLTYQVEKASEVANKIIELSQLVQEVTPRYIRTQIVSIDGTPVDELDAHYELLNSGGAANAGARFHQFPDKVLWANFHEYIETAYQNYTPRVRESLHLRQVLGYYVDARDPDRPVEGKMLSVCSAIELFALWHAREDCTSESTGAKIRHLVEKLDVETEDLAQSVVENLGELDVPEYFWRRSRNYVSHGDPNVEYEELINSYEATLILLKRIIRNQLLGSENDSFDDFYSMTPRPRIEFGN